MEDARRLSGTSGLATAVLLSQYQTPGLIRLSRRRVECSIIGHATGRLSERDFPENFAHRLHFYAAKNTRPAPLRNSITTGSTAARNAFLFCVITLKFRRVVRK